MAQVGHRQRNKKLMRFTPSRTGNLDIRDKEFMVFVGPSGCGKTTGRHSGWAVGDRSIDYVGRANYDRRKVLKELATWSRHRMVFQNYELFRI